MQNPFLTTADSLAKQNKIAESNQYKLAKITEPYFQKVVRKMETPSEIKKLTEVVKKKQERDIYVARKLYNANEITERTMMGLEDVQSMIYNRKTPQLLGTTLKVSQIESSGRKTTGLILNQPFPSPDIRTQDDLKEVLNHPVYGDNFYREMAQYIPYPEDFTAYDVLSYINGSSRQSKTGKTLLKEWVKTHKMQLINIARGLVNREPGFVNKDKILILKDE
jgi:hypothetical protein